MKLNMKLNFKLNVKLTPALTLPALLTLAACSPGTSGKMLELQPGARGTFLAVGADTDVSLTSTVETDSGQPAWVYRVKAASTKDISIGAAVGGDKADGQEGAYDETQGFIPASITKVMTSAIALKELGADYRFNTDVTWIPDAQNPSIATQVIVFSDGDPQTSKTDTPDGRSRARLEAISQLLKSKGLSKIVGDVLFVSSEPRKDAPLMIPGTETMDNYACYSALAQGFNYRRNCADVGVLSPEKASWSDKDLFFPTQLQVTAGSKTALDVEAVKDDRGVVMSYLFKGTLNPKSSSDNWFALPVDDARTWFGNALLSLLEREGVDTSGAHVVTPDAGESRQLLSERTNPNRTRAGVSSDKLSDLLRFMNKPSDDFLADAIFLAIAEHGVLTEGTMRDQGVETYKTMFANYLKQGGASLFADDLKINDGAGLSRSNVVTARAYLSLLKEFAKDPAFPVLWNSLPIAGRDGTLKGRMGGTIAEGRVHAKTGTVHNFYQLAGYIPRYKGSEVVEYVPFVILSQAPTDKRLTVHAFQDELVVRLMKALNPQL